MSKQYIDQLTWLRGFAAFLVIVSHCMRATEVTYTGMDEASSFWLFSLLDAGSYGVVLFFALSGCTLYISNKHISGYNQMKSFYIKRFFRIWPAFAVSLIAYFLFQSVFSSFYVEPQGHWIEKQFLADFSISDVFAYLTLTFNVMGPSGLFNNAYWSLPVEFQYYIIFPLVVISLRKFGLIGPILISAVIYALPKFGLLEFDRNIVFTLTFSFSGGVIVGYWYLNSAFRMKAIYGGTALLCLFLLSSAIGHKIISLPNLPVLADKWVWFGSIAIVSVYVVLVTKFNVHHTVEKVLKDYGTISYSTYLYHNLIIALSILCLIHFQINDAVLRLLFCFSMTMILSYMAAKYSYKYIEEPSIGIGRRVSHRMTKSIRA